MPIIEPHSINDPLNQGDLLHEIKLYFTGKTDALAGGEPLVSKSNICLVLSRACVIAHKKSIVVASVEKMPSQTPVEVRTLDRAIHYLNQLRDGNDSPDVFYLGQLAGKELEGRFVARLDSIHTIEVPQKPDLRKAFTNIHRFAKLNIDFQRNLHTRLFQSFASLGYEDYSWYSDADLKFIVEMGKLEIKGLQVERDRFIAALQADGGKANELTVIENKMMMLEKRTKPFQEELNLRQS